MPSKKRVRIIALDLDGVVYNGDRVCHRARETVAWLRTAGYTVVFMTNNSARSRVQIAGKLNGMAIPTDPDQVLTSGTAAGLFLRQHLRHSQTRRVTVIGTDGLVNEIADIVPLVKFIGPGKASDVLVVGFTKEFGYSTIQAALQTLLRGAFFLACNCDSHFPGERGRRLPGCGAMVGAIAGALGRGPDAVAGKPEPLMLEWLCKRCRCSMAQVVVVGDSVQSDILMARKAGAVSILLTSKSGDGMGIQPTAVLEDIGALPGWLKTHR